jgi:drug/metabolite transporter (DMT)-like permease
LDPHLLQSVGQKYTSASLAAVILSLESVFGALAGAIVLHETMSPFAVVGCVIILAAVIISQLEFKEKPVKR